jgi:hypothetical protein
VSAGGSGSSGGVGGVGGGGDVKGCSTAAGRGAHLKRVGYSCQGSFSGVFRCFGGDLGLGSGLAFAAAFGLGIGFGFDCGVGVVFGSSSSGLTFFPDLVTTATEGLLVTGSLLADRRAFPARVTAATASEAG